MSVFLIVNTLAIPRPRSVVSPVKWVVRTEVPEEEVVEVKTSPKGKKSKKDADASPKGKKTDKKPPTKKGKKDTESDDESTEKKSKTSSN